MKDDTKLVTAGRHPEENHGIVNPPVYHASTVIFPSLSVIDKALAGGAAPKTMYGRRGTPTTFSLQEAMTVMDGAYDARLCPSGLGAITTALQAFVGSGDHILMTDSVYAPTRAFCDRFLSRYDIETTYYDPLIAGGIRDLIRDNTRVVFTEAPGSLTFEMQDIPAIAEEAHKRSVIVMMDNTWATPLFYKAYDKGVDVVVHAATKYIVGHSDVMMGVITAKDRETFSPIAAAHGQLGTCAGPDDVYLAQRGLRTMAVRLRQHQENGIQLAVWLKARPEVRRVLHPALPEDPGHSIWRRDFTGASGLFGIVIEPCSRKALGAMLDELELFGMGYSWGGFESLIVAPDPRSNRTATQWQEDGQLLRLHAGLENADDLIADLEAGFDRLKAAS